MTSHQTVLDCMTQTSFMSHMIWVIDGFSTWNNTCMIPHGWIENKKEVISGFTFSHSSFVNKYSKIVQKFIYPRPNNSFWPLDGAKLNYTSNPNKKTNKNFKAGNFWVKKIEFSIEKIQIFEQIFRIFLTILEILNNRGKLGWK